VLEVIEKCREEYATTYKPMYEQLVRARVEEAALEEKTKDITIHEKN
jgi:hypothetical protein